MLRSPFCLGVESACLPADAAPHSCVPGPPCLTSDAGHNSHFHACQWPSFPSSLTMLCRGFLPTVMLFLQRVPVLGWLLDQPFVRQVSVLGTPQIAASVATIVRCQEMSTCSPQSSKVVILSPELQFASNALSCCPVVAVLQPNTRATTP